MESKRAFSSLLKNSMDLRNRLSKSVGEASKTALKTRDKDDIKEYLEVVKEYYMNEQSILFLNKCLNSIDFENENFSIVECLENTMEIFSIQAQLNNCLLTLETEACFPKEVCSDKKKFELLMAAFVIYFSKACSNSELKVTAKLKCPSPTGFVLSFSIFGSSMSKSSQEELNKIFVENDPTIIYSCQYGVRIYNCKIMLEQLNSTIDMQFLDSDSVRLCMEIPFDNPISSEEAVPVSAIRLFKRRKINEYTTQWLNELLPVENPPLLAMSSPAPGQLRRLDFSRLQQSKMATNRSADKDKVIERLIREQASSKSEADALFKKYKGWFAAFIDRKFSQELHTKPRLQWIL
eukprot:TRINITY_DN1161_c0_g1_i6.p1 TRINITY_DN1161_c0_g1~~TRINITY_DN1161_c0_g1_i6.p1  ORF type:complete len:350 (+),score=104.08 TRINITY_DN1161_c0_g1_i6:1183-2232(+)